MGATLEGKLSDCIVAGLQQAEADNEAFEPSESLSKVV